MGGNQSGSSNIIEYITIATTGNSTDFGDLLTGVEGGSACTNNVSAVYAGGYTGSYTNVIQYVTIASTGNATDFGDLTIAKGGYIAGCAG